MSDDLIERLRRPDVLYNRGPDYEPLTIPASAVRLEAADALAAKDTALSEMRAELERWAEQANKEDECRQIWQAQVLAAEAELERVTKALLLTPTAERVAELPHFMAALAEWGCTDSNEQAQAITEFLNSMVGLKQYLEEQHP